MMGNRMPDNANDFSIPRALFARELPKTLPPLARLGLAHGPRPFTPAKGNVTFNQNGGPFGSGRRIFFRARLPRAILLDRAIRAVRIARLANPRAQFHKGLIPSSWAQNIHDPSGP